MRRSQTNEDGQLQDAALSLPPRPAIIDRDYPDYGTVIRAEQSGRNKNGLVDVDGQRPGTTDDREKST